MDGVSDAASLVALFQLATNVIAYVKNVTDAPTQRRKLLVALLQARGLLSTLIDLTNECDEEDWSRTIQSLSIDNGPLSTFRDILSQLAGKLGIVTTRSNISAALNRLRWPFDQPSLQEMIDSLEKLKSHFLIAIANDHVRLSMAIRDEVYAVHRQLHTVIKDSQKRAIASLSREQELIVKSLSSVELSGELKGDEIMKLRASAEWFLLHDDFQRWHKTSPTSPNKEALVLIGLPGSGKSSICQVTRFFLKAWHQSDIDIASAYFSFRYSQREKQKESLVLSNIVQQLVLERPYLIEHITALKATGGPFSSSEGIDFICRARRDLKGLYLILDGLDESQTVGKALVEDLLAIEPPLSILVTARAHAVPDILRTLESCVLLNMNDAAMSSANIETVIQMLEKEPRIAGYLEYDSEAIADAARLIVERSEGLWIYTNGLIANLAQAETRAVFRRLLNSPPSDLHELYQSILENVNRQSIELVALAKKTLTILLNTEGPVSAKQLMGDMALELISVTSAQNLGRQFTKEEMVEVCLSSCKGFVTSDSEPSMAEPRLQLVHFSVRMFLKVVGFQKN